jgi:hypothetical protein
MFISAIKTIVAAAVGVAVVLGLLIIELIATVLVYTYLNLYHLSTFGALVRLAREVQDALVGQLEFWLPGSANSAYATLFGELGPKSFLLLLLGLLVSAIIRVLVRGLRRLGRRNEPAVEA